MAIIKYETIHGKKGDLPAKPLTYIYIDGFGDLPGSELPALSSSLCGEKDIDDYIDSLIRDLEKTRRLAKKNWKKWDKQIHEWNKQRIQERGG